MKKTIIGLGIFAVSTLHAGSATHCIELYDAGRSAGIKNTCNYEITVVWCHKGPGDAQCGGNDYYQVKRSLDPGETRESKYRLPKGQRIEYVACRGGFNSLEVDDGSVSCD